MQKLTVAKFPETKIPEVSFPMANLSTANFPRTIKNICCSVTSIFLLRIFYSLVSPFIAKCLILFEERFQLYDFNMTDLVGNTRSTATEFCIAYHDHLNPYWKSKYSKPFLFDSVFFYSISSPVSSQFRNDYYY